MLISFYSHCSCKWLFVVNQLCYQGFVLSISSISLDPTRVASVAVAIDFAVNGLCHAPLNWDSGIETKIIRGLVVTQNIVDLKFGEIGRQENRQILRQSKKVCIFLAINTMR